MAPYSFGYTNKYYDNYWMAAHSMNNYMKIGKAYEVISDYNSDGMYTGMATKAKMKAASQTYFFLKKKINQAETKGSSRLIRPEKFIVTSNYSIDHLFPDPVLAQAIRRRFYVIEIPMRRH